MTYDSTRLHAELAASGLSIRGCRSAPRSDQVGLSEVDAVIDWPIGHPTASERAMAQSVLAAHDPDKRTRDDATEIARLREILGKMEAGTSTLAEERELLRKGLRRLLGR